MKRKAKLFSILIFVLIIFSMFSVCYAGDLINQMKPDATVLNSHVNIANVIIGTLRFLGYATAVVVLVYVGIKYIMASADERGDMKTALPKYLAGALLIIFGVEFINLIFKMFMRLVVKGGSKMKKQKILISLLTILLIFNYTLSFATGILPDVSAELPVYQDKANQLVKNFGGAMMFIGYAIAAGMIVFIGIKYVMASADERASLKGMIAKVIAGSIIIALSFTIVGFISGILTFN